MKSLSSVRPVILLAFVNVALSQRVAPGVPPQQYQPPPQQVPQYQQQQVPNPQYQQPHQQHAPQPQQHHQPPPQQQQHHQQPPPQQQHHQPPPQQQQQHQPHGHHGQQPQVLNPGNIQEERDHIKEHLEVPIDTSKMTEQELQFHYFKMHDSDNNNKLDGCELIKSLIHWHATDEPTDPDQIRHAMYTDSQLEAIVDQVLGMMDKNKDGFVEYHEYIGSENAQNRADDLKANPHMQTRN
ncbi:multiple coagulation factor deficiency protein 2 homolog isoform X1 [Lutzomyia longipalpis]|uniref:multiple coagulation factor deficiency protein 2 homolog isoform X1 n=1 Tax=Lutzomyia longipalpis TaxID=7200 RepID=UPI0024835408|nr:multiple coagulation factor deficiency protein 2 homolog isoform X1 [Lutzomyia longipalpis]